MIASVSAQKFFEPIDAIANTLMGEINEIPETNLRTFRKMILDQYEKSKSIDPKIREWKRLITQPTIGLLRLTNSPVIKEFDSPKLPGSKDDYAAVAQLEEDHISFWVRNDLRESNVSFCHFDKALAEHLINDSLISQLSSIQRNDRYSILAAGAGEHSVCINVPDNTQIGSPLLIKIDQTQGMVMMPVFINVFLGKNSEADLIIEEGSSSALTEQSLITAEINVFAEDFSKLGVVETQQLNRRTQFFITERFFLKENSYTNYLLLEKGSGLTKRNLAVNLDGEGSEAVITGLYQPDHEQKFIFDTHQNHYANRTISDLLFKGVLGKNAYALWQGNIYVAKGTIGADGYQMNNNLLLDKNAHAESIPGLEIIADDVRCSHGVTISDIDQEQLFYLKSRGIDEKNGKQLIIDGFTRNAFQRIHTSKMIEAATKYLNISG